jgi:hypothetical protein
VSDGVYACGEGPVLRCETASGREDDAGNAVAASTSPAAQATAISDKRIGFFIAPSFVESPWVKTVGG